MTRRIYLAASFGRRAEMEGYARELAALGHQVTSRWIRGGHEAGDDDLLGADRTLAIRLASEDWDDLEASDLVLNFTGAPTGANRGGRHVEYGLVIGSPTIVCWIVGPLENVFHALADRQFGTWPEAKEALGG